MGKGNLKKVAFISSYLPRKCGIATFTSDLIQNIAATAKSDFKPLVVATSAGNHVYEDPVKFEIRQNVKNDYISAADYINFSYVDLVSVQHEFGLFGGDAGSYLPLLLNRLKAPIITTLHTVLDDPDSAYYKSMIDVCNASYKVITMNERGVSMLADTYGINEKKIELIPHGIPDLPFVDNNYYKHKFTMEGRRTILTFGLLSKNKGIEVMLKAMPDIIKAEPSVLYIILGMTHPSVLRSDGESYRFSLQRLVKELGLQEHVIFHNRFVSDEELSNFLCAADIYVTPYLSREQLTSGTLSFAVGTGKAVVSTPYWAAMELLSDGRGKIVPFGDWKQTADAIIEILKNDTLFYALRRKAYDYGRARTWPKTGQIYWKLFTAKKLPVRIPAKAAATATEPTSSIEVPEPSLMHLKRLTDDTGLFQHAKFTIPNRSEGYCTDDNARAVIAMAQYYAQYPEPQALNLFNKYLAFIMSAQSNDGSIRNFMNFDRTWAMNKPVGDALGRTLWAFGTVMAKPPSLAYMSIIKDAFDRSVKFVNSLYPRGLAYSILGLALYLSQFPGASDIKRLMITATDKLVDLFNKNCRPDWHWFESALTYDNAVLPHALYIAGLTFANEKYIDTAEKSCEFLIENTFDGNHFSFIGNYGWYKQNGKKAQFDQQPLEAASTILMLTAAYDATLNTSFLKLQRKAFGWFLGENDLRIPVYNFRTKGCHDGLMQTGVNLNQGAESLLSFLLGQLTIIETYTIVEEITESTDISEKIINAQPVKITNNNSKLAPIKNISTKLGLIKKVEEPT